MNASRMCVFLSIYFEGLVVSREAPAMAPLRTGGNLGAVRTFDEQREELRSPTRCERTPHCVWEKVFLKRCIRGPLMSLMARCRWQTSLAVNRYV